MATKKATKSAEAQQVKDIVVGLNYSTITIPIESISPLIVNHFSHSTDCLEQPDEGIWENTSKPKPKKKEKPTPQEEYESSIYYFEDGVRTGFPAVAFKAAMVRAAKEVYGRVMLSTRSLFHVIADDEATGLIEIHGEHQMRFDVVKVGGMSKVSAPRYRAEYPVWGANITIRYIENAVTPQELVAFLGAAGFTCGIGEWRPEKCNSGSFGLFKVADMK